MDLEEHVQRDVMASQTSGTDAGSSGQAIVSELEASDLPSGRLIGKGSCGIVYETTWKSKRSARKYFQRVPSEVFRKEASVLKELEVHENVVSTYDFTVNNGSCSLVLEYMDDDLLSLLQKWKELERSQAGKGSKTLPAAPNLVEYSTLPDLLRLMLQISRGMRYLHTKGITHEDLKPRNILVTYSNEGVKSVKVSDFGLVQTKSKSMKFSVSSRAHVFDMAQWKAPEILKSMFGNALQGINLLDEDLDEDELEEMVSRMVHQYSNEAQRLGLKEGEPCDVYSFAGTCFQILTGKAPYPNLHWNELTKIVNQELKPILPDAFEAHPDLGDLLKSCWAADPKDRPNFSKICASLESILQERASSSSKPNEEFVSDSKSQDSVFIVYKDSDARRPALLMESEMRGADGQSDLPFIGTGGKYIMVLRQYRWEDIPLTAQLDHSNGFVREPRNSQHDGFPKVTDSTDFDQSKVMRLFIDSFYSLQGRQLRRLIYICHVAHHSEEFFLGGTNQWVQTSITSTIAPDVLLSGISDDGFDMLFPVTIHSNVLPRCPPWTTGWAVGGGAFPVSVLKEAINENIPLKEKLMQKKSFQLSLVEQDEYQIGQHGSHISGILDTTKSETIFGPMDLRPLWVIQADAVSVMRALGYSTSLVRWRGGLFVRLDRSLIHEHIYDLELHVVRKLSHPHIVYIFGTSDTAGVKFFYREYMQNDLHDCIEDKVYISGDNNPPFSYQDSVDILLQLAKAMAYMHQEDVVHGDVNPFNILISEYSMSRTEKHFLIKVAGFDSAQFVSSESRSTGFNTGFNPGGGTTRYAAPEVLEWRSDREVVISSPKKIDVYSFAIVAFKVLTGEEPYRNVHSPSNMVKGIIEGSLRPHLFLHDKNLLSLIESCWHGDPSKRPSFSEIVEVLESIRRVDAV